MNNAKWVSVAVSITIILALIEVLGGVLDFAIVSELRSFQGLDLGSVVDFIQAIWVVEIALLAFLTFKTVQCIRLGKPWGRYLPVLYLASQLFGFYWSDFSIPEGIEFALFVSKFMLTAMLCGILYASPARLLFSSKAL